MLADGGAETLFPGHRHAGGGDLCEGGDADIVDREGEGHGRDQRAEREAHAEATVRGIVQVSGVRRHGPRGREEADIADEEHFRQLAAALEPDLLAGIRPLRLADLSEGPEEARTPVGERHVKTRTRDVDRGAPARRGAAVEVGRVPDEPHAAFR